MNAYRFCCVSLALLLLTAFVPSAADEKPHRSVTVTGQGEVDVKPDRARVLVGVEARNLKLVSAQSKVNTTVEAFLKLTKDLGIAGDHVRSSRVTVRPEYTWDNQAREQRFVGYYVARQMEVDLHDLDKLGRLIEGALGTGVNQVSDPQLLASEEQTHYRKALALAANDARRNAETLAKELGAKVGAPRTLSATQTGYAPPPPVPVMARMESATPQPGADTYTTGEIKFTAQVNAEFDLIVEQ